MLGRIFCSSDEDWKFGFNGEYKVYDVKGSGVQYDYGFRIYDSRIAKFLSVDPLTASYPWNSPYAFAKNGVLRCIDLDGLDKVALSGASLPSQYWLPVPGSGGYQNTPGHTSYTPNQDKFFMEQGARLEKAYGYHTHQVFSGKDIVDKLVSETQNHGSITSLAFFAHGGPTGLYLNYDEGFYKSGQYGKVLSATISEIVTRVNIGDIQFSKDAVFFFDACRVAGDPGFLDNSIAYDFVLKTGVTSFAATGSVFMSDLDIADGKFKTNGEFLKYLARNLILQFKLTIRLKFYEFWKPNKVEINAKIYKVESENLGNEVNMDEHIQK